MLASDPAPPVAPGAAPRRTIRLRALLYEVGWRRADLGRAIGLPPTVTSRVFDGVRPLKLDEAARLARALSVAAGRRIALEDLLDGDE